MRPMYSPSKPMPNRQMPNNMNAMPNSVNKPSASGPITKRRMARKMTKMVEMTEVAMPSMEKNCNGISEKPVIKSKFRRINFDNGYFDSPAARSSCSTSTSAGLRE